MMRRLLSILCLCLGSQALAAAPDVVVTIKPIYSLVAGVMKGVGTPKLLLSSHEDPHHFSLSPSDAKLMGEADLLIWVGPQMELALQKAVKTLAAKARVVTLMDLPGIVKYDLEPEHVDPHIWLDPHNAKVIVQQTAAILSGLDPNNAGLYDTNANNIEKQLDAMTEKLREELAPVKTQRYFVYHDAFQYFEKAFDLSRSTPLVKDTEGSLRATQRQRLEKLAKEQDIRCVFGEPSHGENVVQSFAEQLSLKVSYLDPMGLTDPSTPEGGYMNMMSDLASTIKACLLKDHRP